MSSSLPPKIPNFIQTLLDKRRAFDSQGDIRSRETAIKIMLKNTHANFDGLFLATVAATIHPRHLWSLMQYPPLGPAVTPWAFQEAFKAIATIRNNIITTIAEESERGSSLSSSQDAAATSSVTSTTKSSSTPETNLLDQLLERSTKKLAELRKVFRKREGVENEKENEQKQLLEQQLHIPSASILSTCISIKPDAAGDGVHGSVIISKPVPPSTTIFKVPGHHLFNALTVAQYSKLGSVLSQEPWKSALDDDDEALLIMTLIYENFVVGANNSRWEAFLTTCPKHFPHIPLCWDEEDLMALDPSMFAAVAEKGESIQVFVEQCRALLAKIEETYPDHFHKNNDSSSSKGRLVDMISAETVTWARCVFDSRSFVLKYSGDRERTTLAPFIDMLNHDCYSDILSRRIVVDHQNNQNKDKSTKNNSTAVVEELEDDDENDEAISQRTQQEDAAAAAPSTKTKTRTTQNGDIISKEESSTTNFFFEMISSPFELTKESVGSELYLSYGPLETWELLISYGFVLEGCQDGRNCYDVLPLPIDYDADYINDEVEDYNHENDENEDDDPLSSLRKHIIRKCGLESLQKHGLFIPVDGKIPIALRHIIAIWHEQDEKYLRKHLSLAAETDDDLSSVGFTGFEDGDDGLDRLLSRETLASVDDTCDAALTMMLEEASPHSLEKDLADLKNAPNDNVRAAVSARLTLKNIAKRGLEKLKFMKMTRKKF